MTDKPFTILLYMACWESPEIMGSGSTQYGLAYCQTEQEALNLIRTTGRNTLQRKVKYQKGDNDVTFATHWYDFESQAWRGGPNDEIIK